MVQSKLRAAQEPGAGVSAPAEDSSSEPASCMPGLAALCLVARLHHIAAEPAHLAHRMGWPPSHRPTPDDLLRGARQLGLKAKLTRTTAERLPLMPLPALALLADSDGKSGVVVLAQCDGQRVLCQDPSGARHGGRPTIEPMSVFEAEWTGELILIASRASLAGALAKFARGAENQALLVETVTGIQTVKASALEPAIAKRWDDQLAAYRFGSGYGVDTVQENDATAGIKDAVQFVGSVTQSNVQFKQVGNNLEVLLNGATDKVVIQNWYLGSQYHVEEFRFTDSTVLLDSQVQGLVSAMASFNAPTMGIASASMQRPHSHMLAGQLTMPAFR